MYKSKEHENLLKNIKTFYETREKVVKLFDDFSTIASKAKHTSFHEKKLKILIPKQKLQSLPIALAQVKAGTTSENLLNGIRQIIYLLYQAKGITKEAYNNIMNIMKTIKHLILIDYCSIFQIN